jgi:hypothetical protein
MNFLDFIGAVILVGPFLILVVIIYFLCQPTGPARGVGGACRGGRLNPSRNVSIRPL